MTYSSYYMPGAFFDNAGSGVHPSVFRPPVSPSASSSIHLGKSTVLQSEATTPAAHAKRKRAYTQQQQQQQPVDAGRNRGPTNPEHFPLAGQLETPGGFQGDGESTVLEESLYSDYDFRRALGSKPSQTAAESPASGQPTLLIRPVDPPAGWSRAAFNTLGGVVGKVWEFCTSSAFKGFYAGGGAGYSIDDATPRTVNDAAATEHSPGDYFSSRATAGDSTPVPGGFPQADYIPDGCTTTGTTTPDATPSRPTKRRQISGADDILKNWVVVDELNSADKGRPSSRMSSRTPGRATPSRNTRPSVTTGRRISVPVSRINTTPGPVRRSSHRASYASSPAPSNYEPASYAGMRSFRPASPPPLSPSPSRIPIPVSASREHSNPYTSPRPSSAASNYRTSVGGVMSPTSRPGGHRRTHSGASAASGRAPREDETALSPRLTDEARRLAAKRRREEKDNDMRMNDFNSRLQAMIQQGKEALGTTIEVDGEGAGGGWESDE
ncbi:hypothetical protein F5X68DRAFT_209444 [Plectosphaerella plurivora]|uniref:Uncharacterized protein n=1 Tax=Plectosphaerella plurivora TaxID=936078 RepID=A0A9P9A9I7_9PEZI|nr:hypothetical protein F5X68DRAFT_209444 [Plectosphaerella plurivora]